MYLKNEFMNQGNFLNADSDAIIFGQTDTLLFYISYSLNAGVPLQLYFLFQVEIVVGCSSM